MAICSNNAIGRILNWQILVLNGKKPTVNGERFAGLNFHVFCGFQEHRESFPVNLGQASYDGVV